MVTKICKSLFFIFVFLLGFISVSAEITTLSSDYKELFFKGLEYFDSGENSKAVEYFNQSLIESKNSYSPALFYIAESYLSEKMYNQAGSYYWKFINHSIKNKNETDKNGYYLRYYQRVIYGLSQCYKLNPKIADRIEKNMENYSIDNTQLYLDILYSSLYKAFLNKNYSGSYVAAKVYINKINKQKKESFDARIIDIELIKFCIYVETGKTRKALSFIDNFNGRYTKQIIENANVPDDIINMAKYKISIVTDTYFKSFNNASNFNYRLKQASLRRYKKSLLIKKAFLMFF